MRELTACLIIVSLTLINGAPPNEASKISPSVKEQSTTYKLFNDNNNQLVYKICVDFGGGRNCKIIKRSVLDGSVKQVCDLDSHGYGNTSVLSVGKDNVILSFGGGNDNKVATVDLKSCNVKEVILDVDVPKIRYIVFHDDKYHVIFIDSACLPFYCKATYHSSGKTVRPVATLHGVYADSGIRMKVGSKGFLLNEFGIQGPIRAYFVPYEGSSAAELMYSVPRYSRYHYSMGEDKIGYCSFDEGKAVTNSTKNFVCQQYDAEGKTKILDVELQFDHGPIVTATNADEGLFVSAGERQLDDRSLVKHTIVYVDENGKQGKPVNVDLQCEKNYDLHQNFYKNPVGEFCATLVCINPFYPSEVQARANKCFDGSALI